ncbi:MAG TPA: NAD(P)H-dependent oxidoreductase subunit E [bacterium]|nr:NAD(P)H-dependent oxidoreductase subunit E [bacterium]
MTVSGGAEDAAFLAAFSGPQVRGRASLEICQGCACREVGNEELLAGVERLAGLRRGDTSDDGALTLIAGFCQGRCAIGPNVRLNGTSFSVEGPDQAAELLHRALTSGGRDV